MPHTHGGVVALLRNDAKQFYSSRDGCLDKSATMLSHPNSEPNYGWIIGVLVFIAGNIINGLGTNLQRYSMMTENAKEDDEEQKPCYKQPYMFLGVGLFVGSGLIMGAALPFAPQTLLAPCGTSIFIANVVFAYYINGERFFWVPDGVCIAFIMAGIVLCLLSAPERAAGQTSVAELYTAEQLLDMYRSTTFIVFCTFLGVIVITCFVMKIYLKRLRQQSSVLFCIVAGLLPGVIGGFIQTITKTMWAVMGGQYEHHGGLMGIVTSPACWALALSLLFAFTYQLYSIADGLNSCPASIFVPMQAGTEVLTAVLGGLFYFQDYKMFNIVQGFLFTLGMMTAISSLVSLVVLRDDGEPTNDLESATEAKPLLGSKWPKWSKCCN